MASLVFDSASLFSLHGLTTESLFTEGRDPTKVDYNLHHGDLRHLNGKEVTKQICTSAR
jgi:hypothetical protein